MARILIVQADQSQADAVVDLFSRHQHTVVHVRSGEEALDELARERTDLVLLDLKLPGMDGLETCAAIRERHGPLPVIVTTGLVDADAIRRGYEVGADDVLRQPLDFSELILKARVFLRIKSLHDDLVAHREAAQVRARDLAQLHEIGRDWSLIAEPEEFHRVVTQRLASLIRARVCFIALYDSATKTLAAALPAHGLPDEKARAIRYVVRPEYRLLWNFRTGRPYVSNSPRSDPRLIQEFVQASEAESIVLVPMLSEGAVLGLLVAANKPGGFTDADVQLLSIFAGPAATFLRSRQIFDNQRRHASRLERMSSLAVEMGACVGRGNLLNLAVSRIRRDLGYQRVAFYRTDEETVERGTLTLECAAPAESSTHTEPSPPGWTTQGVRPLRLGTSDTGAELAVPVRAGEEMMGLLHVTCAPGGRFSPEEASLLTTVAGQLAVALQKSESVARTENLAWQMATLYDLGLETAALQDLRVLFARAAEEAGRLIRADHTSVLQLDEAEQRLRLFAAWARDPERNDPASPEFVLSEGVAGRVARDRVPAMVNEPDRDVDFVTRGHPVARLMCVPLTYFDQERQAIGVFGVLNATRRPGQPPFNADDLEYLTRFASQLSIAVANSMAFSAERERSEQIALVNALLREIAGNLSKERILETAVRRIQEAFRFSAVTIGVPDTAEGLQRVAAGASRDPRPPDWGRFLAIPIVSGEETLAVLKVESDRRRAFGRGDVMTLETLADGIGISLRNAELYQTLERTNAKLVELDRLKSELVNIVAHDFRAPLTGLLSYAELLEWKADVSREERVEHARGIIQAATHMANLVNKTLKTTRLETGNFPFAFGLVDLAQIAREVVDRFPRDPQHPLVAEISEDPVPAWADADRVAEVMENLFSNAVKYSPAGGTVRLEVRREGDSAVVSVMDEGIGIAAEHMDRLFRPFSRIPSPQSASIEGSGLGLYICDRIVRAHGGRLWAESGPSRGARFFFSLPVFGLGAQSQVPTVLVAAGDERTRREVRRTLEERGFRIHEVSDGVDAVEATYRLLPAAVILDRVLPRLGAEEIAARLRQNERTERVPLFALATEAELGGSSGLFTAWLPKPVNRSALLDALDRIEPRRTA